MSFRLYDQFSPLWVYHDLVNPACSTRVFSSLEQLYMNWTYFMLIICTDASYHVKEKCSFDPDENMFTAFHDEVRSYLQKRIFFTCKMALMSDTGCLFDLTDTLNTLDLSSLTAFKCNELWTEEMMQQFWRADAAFSFQLKQIKYPISVNKVRPTKEMSDWAAATDDLPQWQQQWICISLAFYWTFFDKGCEVIEQ